jgi:monoamine oxidase
MARTRLFGKLRRIAASALAGRCRTRRVVDAGQPLLTRRQLTLGSVQLAAGSAVAGCAGDDSGKRPGSERVAVVGAGIAGLHCAYRLQQAGVSVTVYEASNRIGGRMFTVGDDAVYAGQAFELGGELIDGNHTTLLALAEELEIQLDDRLEDESLQADVWFVAGAEVPEATIVQQFTAVAPLMADALRGAMAEDDDSAFAELDATPLADWLEANVAPAEYPELHAILTAAYRSELGLETAEQSALNLLYLIGSDEPDPFRIFGESDRRYHAHQGSQAFPTRLAELLTTPVQKNLKLIGLRGGDLRGFTLELQSATSGSKLEANFDHVVLAIPFSVLRDVALEVSLSALKRRIIDELGYGTNSKVIGSFTTRVWREEHQKSGAATTDLPLQQVWDSSIGQPGESGILTNLLGGQAGLDVAAVEPEQHYTGLLVDLEQILPGVTDAYRADSARLMHWPSHEHTRGSFACYQPGQWSFRGQEGVREGNLHFCGEHTSVDFQGWMEGGAESGALVAAEILRDLGLEPSEELLQLIGQRPRAYSD